MHKNMKRFIKLFYLSIVYLILQISIFGNTEIVNKKNTLPKVNYYEVEVNSVEDIYKERKGLYVFSNLNIDLRNYSATKRKELFIRLLMPSIKVVREEILNNRKIVQTLKNKKQLSQEEREYMRELFREYKVKYGQWEELESKMIIYPASLILTQGALESAWGTSRFFREANNAFGVWSTNPNEPRIAAQGSRGDFKPHLKKYSDLKETVKDITMIISRSGAYKDVRKMVWEKKSPYEIAEGLINYSEEREIYVRKVKNTMKFNQFEKYDKDLPY